MGFPSFAKRSDLLTAERPSFESDISEVLLRGLCRSSAVLGKLRVTS